MFGELTTFEHLRTFEDRHFRKWNRRMRMKMTGLDLAYVLNEPRPVEDPQEGFRDLARERPSYRWDMDDLACRSLILKGLSDWLFDIYRHHDTAASLMQSLQLNHDVSLYQDQFYGYRMIGSKSVLDHFLEMKRLSILMARHGKEMEEGVKVNVIINRLPPTWNALKSRWREETKLLSMDQLESDIMYGEFFLKFIDMSPS